MSASRSVSRPVVLIACDKFKGTLTADEACEAVAAGIRSLWPEAECLLRPIADGGEGTSRVICQALGGEWRTEEVSGPLGDPVTAGFAWLPATGLAVIEMSEASGLKRVPEGRRDPWRATTAGTGQLMDCARRLGASRIVVGIGGSATNDGGAGMAWALGYQFRDSEGRNVHPLPCHLEKIVRIVPPDQPLPEVVAACDVSNPLLGPDGATAVYGPQKGVTAERLPDFERALARLADLVRRDLGCDYRNLPGAGAAGGLGFGLMSFCGASTRSGFELVAEVTGLHEAIRLADLVVTGEGCLDAQTLHGKGPAGVAEAAREAGRPVAAVGGLVRPDAAGSLAEKFDAVISAATQETLAEAFRRPAEFVRQAVVSRAGLLSALIPQFPVQAIPGGGG